MSSDSHNLIDLTIERTRKDIALLREQVAADMRADHSTEHYLHQTIAEKEALLAQWEDLQVAFGCAVELAIHVDRSAKGTLALEAKAVLSNRHAGQMRKRLGL